MQSRPWVQAAIDVEDMELAKRIAFMALDAGAEWLEVGTPLLYQYGHGAIGTLRRAVGKNAILVADYKSPYAVLCAPQAAREGADMVMLTAGYSDMALSHSVELCKKCGVEPVFDLSVRPEDMAPLTQRLAALGAKYIFTRRCSRVGLEGKPVDHLPFILPHLGDMKLGITSDDLREATDTARAGADWITFGWVLRTPDSAVCQKWIDAIHRAR